MPDNFANLAVTFLDGSIDDSESSITVDDASLFPDAPFVVRIGNEFMRVTDVDGETWDVDRGIEDSLATAHDSGATVSNFITAGWLNQVSQSTTAIRGTAAIEDPDTDVDVPHGADTTPERGEIQASPASLLYDASQWWLSDIGEETFRINLDSAPGNSETVEFDWLYQPGVAVELPEPQEIFWTDFSEYDTGGLPDDWTDRYTGATWTIEDIGDDRHVLRVVAPGSGDWRGVSWDAVGQPSDVEVLVRARVVSSKTSGPHMGVIVRGAGASGAPTMYNVHMTTISTVDNDRYSLYVAGSSTHFANQARSWSQNVWYWYRIRVNDDALQVKRWTDGDAEPGSWHFDDTDATLESGWVGVLILAAGRSAEYDYIAVALNGETAPMPEEP